MADRVIGAIPEFDTDETGTEQADLGSAEAPEGSGEEEKDTLPEPASGEQPDVQPNADDTEIQRQVQGLQAERSRLLGEITELRGQRRDLKQRELNQVEDKIDEIQDLDPNVVGTVERIIRAKGYITKEEAGRMSYEAVKLEQENGFFSKYPEYKPENDPGDVRWNQLQAELRLYRRPDDPHAIGNLLERAHRAVAPVSRDANVDLKKRQVQTAGVGSGGRQTSSSRVKSLAPHYREELLRGGWSEEDIKRIEQNLE